MVFYAQMSSGLGRILLASDGAGLTGLYFIGQKDCPPLDGLPPPAPQAKDPTAGLMSGVAIKNFKARMAAGGGLFGPANLARTGAAGGAPFPGQASRTLCGAAGGAHDALTFMQDGTPHAVEALFERAQRELREYFRGERKAFTLPLAAEGTDFQKKVWRALLAIPYGQSVSYGEVARAAGLTPRHGRPVGTAVGRNPIAIIIPCHRVLGGAGTLTGYSGGLERKFALLELEGFSLGYRAS